MNDEQLEDLIKGISLCFQQNYFAIETLEISTKFKEANEYELQVAIDTMLQRKELVYDMDEQKYRLVLK
jgi:hypothetical protein